MLARAIAIWAFLMMFLSRWIDNHYSTILKNRLFVMELDAEMQAEAKADLYGIGDPGKVVLLTEDTFAKHVSSGKHFVKFFHPWCPHCDRLAPTWDGLAKELEQEPGVSISKIDCIESRGPCQFFEVEEYPLLLWIEDGRMIEMYQGVRSLRLMLHFVKKFLDEKPTTNTSNIILNLHFN